MNEPNGVEHRVERAVFETDRHRITGEVTLPPEGYQSRFSDLLNREALPFLPLINAQVAPLAGGEAIRHRFLAIGKAHIRVAYPLEGNE